MAPYKYYTMKRNLSTCHIFEFDPNEFRFDCTLGVRGRLEKLSKINGEPTNEEKTFAKINGGFFNMNGTSEHIGTYVDDGLYYRAPSTNYPTMIFWKNTKKLDMCLSPTTQDLNNYQGSAQFAIGVPWMLVLNGKKNYVYTKQQLISWFGHPWSRAPRTLFGQKADGTIVWVVVEGRFATSPGFTIDHSSALMLELGCTIAANLDGGGSSEMIVDGKIKNRLSDNAERSIGSALVCYKKIKTTAPINPDTSVIQPYHDTGTINCSELNVRNGAGLYYSIVGSLTRNTPVEIYAKLNGWYCIMYNGEYCWISSQYVTTGANVKITGIVTAALNMRSGPGTTYKKVSLIPKGTAITLLASNNGWYKTTYKGITGWCCGQYVKA